MEKPGLPVEQPKEPENVVYYHRVIEVISSYTDKYGRLCHALRVGPDIADPEFEPIMIEQRWLKLGPTSFKFGIDWLPDFVAFWRDEFWKCKWGDPLGNGEHYITLFGRMPENKPL